MRVVFERAHLARGWALMVEDRQIAVEPTREKARETKRRFLAHEPGECREFEFCPLHTETADGVDFESWLVAQGAQPVDGGLF